MLHRAKCEKGVSLTKYTLCLCHVNQGFTTATGNPMTSFQTEAPVLNSISAGQPHAAK